MSDRELVTDRASLNLLYDISREFAGAMDLRLVLHRVLMLAMKTVGAVSGSIIVLDEAGQLVDSAFLLRSQPHDQNTIKLRLTFEHGLSGWVASNRQAVLVEDTSKDNRWYQRPDDSLDRTGPKSAVSAPILAREQLVGVITLVHPQPGFFTHDHLELFQAIADQAGVAILNARLYAESQRQAQVMAALAECATVINALLSLDEVLQRILEQVMQVLGVQGAFIALVDSTSMDLHVRAAVPQNEPGIADRHFPLGEGIAGSVFREGQGAIVHDASHDRRFVEEVDQINGFESRTVLAAPIRSEGQVIGVLEVINPREGSFEADNLLLLMGIGSLAGNAIRRVDLYESLQTAHKRYQDLFEDSIDAILITDLRGKIIEANHPAQLTCDLTAKELHALTIDKLHLVDWDKVGQNFSKILSGEMISYESVLQVSASKQLPVQIYMRKIRQEGCDPQLQWIMRDISERKALDRMREDMLAMIYHDLRSPLANIVSSLELISTQLDEDKNYSPDALLKIALRSTDRIQRLTDSLLDIQLLEAGQVISGQQFVKPDLLVAESAEVVLPAVLSKEIKFQVNVSKDLPEVLVDLNMLRRVVINLLENAVKFTPSKGSIIVGARHGDNFVHFSVIDTGPGIPAADHKRIFQKFTRLNVASGPSGLGLGLAFCQLAITRHGGQIWVDSEVGRGSSFNFTLPVASKFQQ